MFGREKLVIMRIGLFSASSGIACFCVDFAGTATAAAAGAGSAILLSEGRKGFFAVGSPRSSCCLISIGVEADETWPTLENVASRSNVIHNAHTSSDPSTSLSCSCTSKGVPSR